MARSKKENAMEMEPNRFQIAKNMSVMPGGPMNNNPMNVTSIDIIKLALSQVLINSLMEIQVLVMHLKWVQMY